jgi:hypothetical protein
MESGEVQEAAIHDGEGACFQRDHIQHIDFVDFSVGDMDKARDIAPQVQQGMKSEGSLCFPEGTAPRER